MIIIYDTHDKRGNIIVTIMKRVENLVTERYPFPPSPVPLVDFMSLKSSKKKTRYINFNPFVIFAIKDAEKYGK